MASCSRKQLIETARTTSPQSLNDLRLVLRSACALLVSPTRPIALAVTSTKATGNRQQSLRDLPIKPGRENVRAGTQGQVQGAKSHAAMQSLSNFVSSQRDCFTLDRCGCPVPFVTTAYVVTSVLHGSGPTHHGLTITSHSISEWIFQFR